MEFGKRIIHWDRTTDVGDREQLSKQTRERGQKAYEESD